MRACLGSFLLPRENYKQYMRNIAQMVERRMLNPEGVGSNPTVSLCL